MSEPFIGEIRMWGLNYAPRGWAFCNGQLLPIAQNTALFSILGTTYGGDGRSTFGLPDLQDRTPVHPGRGPGLPEVRLGERGGTSTVALDVNQIPSHAHTAMGDGDAGDAVVAAGAVPAGFASGYAESGGATVTLPADTIGSTGRGDPHYNLQPSLAINFCIALVGLFPSRG